MAWALLPKAGLDKSPEEWSRLEQARLELRVRLRTHEEPVLGLGKLNKLDKLAIGAHAAEYEPLLKYL